MDATCTAANRASVDDEHNVPGTPILEVDFARAAAEQERMDQAPYDLDQIRRDAFLEAIQEVCACRGWSLLAAHVRSNHVHTVSSLGDVLQTCQAVRQPHRAHAPGASC